MKDLISRIESLQKKLDCSEKITVHFRDGRTRRMGGGPCIGLVQTAPDTISKFEVLGSGQGALPDLLNQLLTDERN